MIRDDDDINAIVVMKPRHFHNGPSLFSLPKQPPQVIRSTLENIIFYSKTMATIYRVSEKELGRNKSVIF